MMGKRELILGVGNTILGDDGIGILVGSSIAERLGILFSEGTSVGFELLEKIDGLDHLIICDAVKVTKPEDVGKVFEFTPDDFKNAFHLTSPHTFNLATGLELGRHMGLNMPETIHIYGIGILTPDTFSEEISCTLKEKFDHIVEEIEKRIRFNN